MAMKMTLPKIQAKLNLVTKAKENYQDNVGKPNEKIFQQAWLKEASDLAGMTAQFYKELQMEIADDQ
ncbi:hypothetical protein BN79_126 [Yersinia phage phiR2-01]|uniref:Uncharacterized protein n=1 Tax=Yersinia phage phiR2-01 TaxID=1206557 RepID=I7KQW8_9CAUD|nr:hypothetical protein BN79_126 [Yersinia phage phiR2-01]CCI88535.1 hypothetical protein BN79_126 [Yersinia phage phiR2-01]